MNLETLVDSARLNLEADGYLAPVFFVCSSSDIKVVIPDLSDESTKEQSVEAVRRLCRETKAYSVVMLAESWSLEPEFSEKFLEGQRRGLWKSVSECPLRKEIVSIIVEEKNKTLLGYANITTDESGKKTFGEITFSEGNCQGRFTHILGPKAVL